MNRYELINRIWGSLAAGAAGDALGYVVEFISYDAILSSYGSKGITQYADKPGLISDDTQMTLFTAEGLVRSRDEGVDNDDTLVIDNIRRSYLDWYRTQTGKFVSGANGLIGDSRLWQNRAPGNTCISALRSIALGNPVDNTSKGCGGIMRIAPVALFAAAHTGTWNLQRVAKIAGKAAFITHHHPLSTLASAIGASIMYLCAISPCILTAGPYNGLIREACSAAKEVFPGAGKYMVIMRELIDKAISASVSKLTDAEVVASLGEGWIAEETLAIALASILRHPDSIDQAIIMAVNHDGDSDSTGAVAGNIIGSSLGYGSIGKSFRDDLEMADTIERTALALSEN